MKLTTIRDRGVTRAVRVDDDVLVDLGAEDLGELFSRRGWREEVARLRAAAGYAFARRDAQPTHLVAHPAKIVCVGLNYRAHIAELGAAEPSAPTLFGKYPEALIGPTDDVLMPPDVHMLDWEAELALIIGAPVRRASEAEAEAAIAGFTIMNDVTVREWQYRTTQWLAGKTWDSTTPVGPVLVTPDELPGGVRPDLRVTCTVDGELMQDARTSDLLFDPVDLVRYISRIVRLRPGDIIATGTPAGIGDAQEPKRFLRDGSVVTCEIEGIGRLTNGVVGE